MSMFGREGLLEGFLGSRRRPMARWRDRGLRGYLSMGARKNVSMLANCSRDCLAKVWEFANMCTGLDSAWSIWRCQF
jgi:hypothetical protein